ncbi:hypothetical protein CIB48_g4745 [Xylaria polymorpha]|nr:hypothetical protein CIB48_g4745 [Xylaria polymorpha]
MCRYRRSIYSCNHTQLSTEPFVICSLQKDYLSGASTEPCNVADTHTCSTIRVWSLCPVCEDTRGELDRRLDEHIDEADLKPESEGDAKSDEAKDTDAKLDPVAAFLKAKKNEKYSHLMMLGT